MNVNIYSNATQPAPWLTHSQLILCIFCVFAFILLSVILVVFSIGTTSLIYFYFLFFASGSVCSRQYAVFVCFRFDLQAILSYGFGVFAFFIQYLCFSGFHSFLVGLWFLPNAKLSRANNP